MSQNCTQNVCLQSESMKCIENSTSEPITSSLSVSTIQNYTKKIGCYAARLAVYIGFIYELIYKSISKTDVYQQIYCVIITRNGECENLKQILLIIFAISLIVVSGLLSLSIMCASLGKRKWYSSVGTGYFVVFKYLDDMSKAGAQMLKKIMHESKYSGTQKTEVDKYRTRSMQRSFLNGMLPKFGKSKRTSDKISIAYQSYLQ